MKSEEKGGGAYSYSVLEVVFGNHDALDIEDIDL